MAQTLQIAAISIAWALFALASVVVIVIERFPLRDPSDYFIPAALFGLSSLIAKLGKAPRASRLFFILSVFCGVLAAATW